MKHTLNHYLKTAVSFFSAAAFSLTLLLAAPQSGWADRDRDLAKQKQAFKAGMAVASRLLLDFQTSEEFARFLEATLKVVKDQDVAFTAGLSVGTQVALFAIIRDFQLQTLELPEIAKKSVENLIEKVVLAHQDRIEASVLRDLLSAFGPLSKDRHGKANFMALAQQWLEQRNFLLKAGVILDGNGSDFSKVDFPTLTPVQKERLNALFKDPTSPLSFTDRYEAALLQKVNNPDLQDGKNLQRAILNGEHVYLADDQGQTHRIMPRNVYEREVEKTSQEFNQTVSALREALKEKRAGRWSVESYRQKYHLEASIAPDIALFHKARALRNLLHEKYGLDTASYLQAIAQMEEALAKNIDIEIAEINTGIQFAKWSWTVPASMYIGSLFMTRSGVGFYTKEGSRILNPVLFGSGRLTVSAAAANNAARLAALPAIFSGAEVLGKEFIHEVATQKFNAADALLNTLFSLREGTGFAATMPALLGILTRGASPFAMVLNKGGLVSEARSAGFLRSFSGKSLKGIHRGFLLLMGGHALKEGGDAVLHYSQAEYEEAVTASWRGGVSFLFGLYGATKTWGLDLAPAVLENGPRGGRPVPPSAGLLEKKMLSLVKSIKTANIAKPALSRAASIETACQGGNCVWVVNPDGPQLLGNFETDRASVLEKIETLQRGRSDDLMLWVTDRRELGQLQLWLQGTEEAAGINLQKLRAREVTAQEGELEAQAVLRTHLIQTELSAAFNAELKAKNLNPIRVMNLKTQLQSITNEIWKGARSTQDIQKFCDSLLNDVTPGSLKHFLSQAGLDQSGEEKILLKILELFLRYSDFQPKAVAKLSPALPTAEKTIAPLSESAAASTKPSTAIQPKPGTSQPVPLPPQPEDTMVPNARTMEPARPLETPSALPKGEIFKVKIPVELKARRRPRGHIVNKAYSAEEGVLTYEAILREIVKTHFKDDATQIALRRFRGMHFELETKGGSFINIKGASILRNYELELHLLTNDIDIESDKIPAIHRSSISDADALKKFQAKIAKEKRGTDLGVAPTQSIPEKPATAVVSKPVETATRRTPPLKDPIFQSDFSGKNITELIDNLKDQGVISNRDEFLDRLLNPRLKKSGVGELTKEDLRDIESGKSKLSSDEILTMSLIALANSTSFGRVFSSSDLKRLREGSPPTRITSRTAVSPAPSPAAPEPAPAPKPAEPVQKTSSMAPSEETPKPSVEAEKKAPAKGEPGIPPASPGETPPLKRELADVSQMRGGEFKAEFDKDFPKTDEGKKKFGGALKGCLNKLAHEAAQTEVELLGGDMRHSLTRWKAGEKLPEVHGLTKLRLAAAHFGYHLRPDLTLELLPEGTNKQELVDRYEGELRTLPHKGPRPGYRHKAPAEPTAVESVSTAKTSSAPGKFNAAGEMAPIGAPAAPRIETPAVRPGGIPSPAPERPAAVEPRAELPRRAPPTETPASTSPVSAAVTKPTDPASKPTLPSPSFWRSGRKDLHNGQSLKLIQEADGLSSDVPLSQRFEELKNAFDPNSSSPATLEKKFDEIRYPRNRDENEMAIARAGHERELEFYWIWSKMGLPMQLCNPDDFNGFKTSDLVLASNDAIVNDAIVEIKSEGDMLCSKGVYDKNSDIFSLREKNGPVNDLDIDKEVTKWKDKVGAEEGAFAKANIQIRRGKKRYEKEIGILAYRKIATTRAVQNNQELNQLKEALGDSIQHLLRDHTSINGVLFILTIKVRKPATANEYENVTTIFGITRNVHNGRIRKVQEILESLAGGVKNDVKNISTASAISKGTTVPTAVVASTQKKENPSAITTPPATKTSSVGHIPVKKEGVPRNPTEEGRLSEPAAAKSSEKGTAEPGKKNPAIMGLDETNVIEKLQDYWLKNTALPPLEMELWKSLKREIASGKVDISSIEPSLVPDIYRTIQSDPQRADVLSAFRKKLKSDLDLFVKDKGRLPFKNEPAEDDLHRRMTVALRSKDAALFDRENALTFNAETLKKLVEAGWLPRDVYASLFAATESDAGEIVLLQDNEQGWVTITKKAKKLMDSSPDHGGTSVSEILNKKIVEPAQHHGVNKVFRSAMTMTNSGDGKERLDTSVRIIILARRTEARITLKTRKVSIEGKEKTLPEIVIIDVKTTKEANR